MDTAAIAIRILQLTNDLNAHNHAYYTLSSPTISDQDFDFLLKELEQLEQDNPALALPYSPTKRVGGSVSKNFNTVLHKAPMLSLSNSYNMEDIKDFHERLEKIIDEPIEYVCELKYDGLAISLHYENGIFVQGVTRGDGIQGDEITANLQTIKSLPLQLQPSSNLPASFEVRGEVILPHSSFQKMNAKRLQELEEDGYSPEEITNLLYKNARNAASGTLKLQDSKEVAKRGLDCFLYFMVQNNLPFATHEESLNALAKAGFQVGTYYKKCTSLDEVTAFITHWETNRTTLPFDTDGVVIKVNSYAQQKMAGNTSKSPRWAIAYKYPTQQVTSILESITYQVGRTGAITPVANLQAVQLGGTTVRRASLHNEDFIKELDLHEKDTVWVEKGGEVIPKITGVVIENRESSSTPVCFITECPECGSILHRKANEAAYYCLNEAGCSTQQIGKIAHFVSRKVMNIQAIGEKTVASLYTNGLIKSSIDLYNLTIENILKLEGFQLTSAQNIVEGVKATTLMPFEKVLYAIGIRYVGETVSKKIARYFKNIDAIMNATLEEINEVGEVGEKIAESLFNFFQIQENKDLVQNFRIAGLQLEIQQIEAGTFQPLLGKSIVVSGTFNTYSRDEIKSLIEKLGGKNVSAISAKTDIVIAGEKMGAEKLKKAQQLNITMLDENAFTLLITPTEAENNTENPTLF